jgi:hypothetical protein
MNMMKRNIFEAIVGGLLLAAATLAGCDANGPGSGGGGGSGSGNGTGVGPVTGTFPNPGTTITDGGNPVPGNFTCTQSAQALNGATTTVVLNGLIGANLTPVLNQIGGNTVTTLLNSVTNKEEAIDGNLDTYSTVALTAGLAGVIDSVGQAVLLPAAQPAGGYAVFAVDFPAGAVTVSVLNNVMVTTYLGDTQQETTTTTQTQLALLGQSGTGLVNAYIGLRTTKPYNRADITLTPAVLAADVGDAMHVHELCTAGTITP